MTFLLDVNVLMALLWENHEHHQVARTWFRGVTDFGTCPVSQLGFARVSSHPALGYSMSPDQASRCADQDSRQGMAAGDDTAALESGNALSTRNG